MRALDRMLLVVELSCFALRIEGSITKLQNLENRRTLLRPVVLLIRLTSHHLSLPLLLLILRLLHQHSLVLLIRGQITESSPTRRRSVPTVLHHSTSIRLRWVVGILRLGLGKGVLMIIR